MLTTFISSPLQYLIIHVVRTVFDPTTLKPKKDQHEPTVAQLSYWEVLRNKRYVLTVCSAGFDGFASASLFVFLPFLLLERHVDPALLGSFTATFFVGTFFGKALLGRFVDTLGSAKVFIAAELLMAVSIYLLAGAMSLPLIIACSVILGVFTKGTVPVLQAMVSESVEHHGNFEKAFSIESFVSSVGITLAPIILGFTSDQFGITKAFYVMACSALLAAIPAILFFILSRKGNLPQAN